ncbi:tyrosine-type recombinase/integrase [Corynebacterium glucuronolyticum]
MGQWLEQFQDIVAKKVKPSTLDTYKRVEDNRILNVQPSASMAEAITRLKDIPLVELKRADVYAWWDAIEKQWPGDGRTFNHKAYVRLKAACTEAVRRELIPTNPVDIPDAAKAPKAKEKYLMENWEPRALIAAADDRVKAVTILTLHHGLRIGEALALNLEDVTITPATDDHPARAEVHITKNFQRLANETTGKMGMVLMDTPKTDAGRRTVNVLVEDVETLAECVARRKKEGAKPSDLLTVATSGGPLLDVDYRNMLNRLKEQTGVSERITPHCGRNWLITRLAEQGVTIKAIGQIMGQSDLKTITEVYMKVSPGATSQAMENLGSLLQKELG